MGFEGTASYDQKAASYPNLKSLSVYIPFKLSHLDLLL